MSYGDVTPGKVVRFTFSSHKADGTPVTLLGTPAISVYKGASTTESTAGVTLTVDFDNRTGLNLVAVDTSADGTFYAAGNDFSVVLTAGAVDSISVVGTKVNDFSISNRSALRPTTADRTLDVSTGGEAGLDWANVGSPTTANALTSTTIATSQVVASVTGAVGSVAGNVGGNVTGTVASVVGAVGSVTGNVGGNVVGSVASVTAAVVLPAIPTNWLTAAGLATDAAAEIAGAVWDLIVSGHTTSGTFGAAMQAAGSAGDPWATVIPGAYGAGTAGHILGLSLPEIAPGGSGGLIINGFNAGTTTFLSLSVLTVSGLSTLTATQVWAAATRTLTAGGLAAVTSWAVDITGDLIGDVRGKVLGTAGSGSIGGIGAWVAGTSGAVLATGTAVQNVMNKVTGLTFTVAGQVDANIQYVNNVAVQGDGSPGTEWGP